MTTNRRTGFEADYVHEQMQNINEDLLPPYSKGNHERPDIISNKSDIALAVVLAKESPDTTILSEALHRH